MSRRGGSRYRENVAVRKSFSRINFFIRRESMFNCLKDHSLLVSCKLLEFWSSHFRLILGRMGRVLSGGDARHGKMVAIT